MDNVESYFLSAIDRIDGQITQEYLDGSIYEHLTKFINTYGYTTTINEI